MRIKGSAEPMSTKVMALVAVLFVGSIFVSYSELKYAVYGRVAVGHVEKVKDVKETGLFGNARSRARVVFFTFFEPGTREAVSAQSRMSPYWSRPVDDVIEVEYVPGEATGRVRGSGNWWAIPAFFAGLIAMVVGSVAFIKGYRDHQHRKRASDVASRQ